MESRRLIFSQWGDSMGFDTIIVSIISIAMILVIAYSFVMETDNIVDSVHTGFNSLHKTTIKRIHTDISIENIRWNLTGNKHLYINVTNTGDTKISDYSLWDVVLIKNGVVEYLDYDTDWDVYAFYNDTINPNILDPSETLEIRILRTFNSGDVVWIEVSTPNGVVAAKRYVVG